MVFVTCICYSLENSPLKLCGLSKRTSTVFLSDHHRDTSLQVHQMEHIPRLPTSHLKLDLLQPVIASELAGVLVV